MKKLRLLLLTVAMLSIFSIGAYAQNDDTKVVSEFTLGNTIFRSVRGADDLIPYISDSFTHQGSYLSLTSTTYASQTCDTLKLVIDIQKNVNGSWVNVQTYTFTDSNTSSLSEIFSHYGTSSSYSYRAIFNHYATLDGSTHTKQQIIVQSY